MSEYQDLIFKVIRNIKERKDITYLISTQDQHTAMISTKKGEISYLRYGSLSGMEALDAFSNMKIESVKERQHSLEHTKSQNSLPSTNEIIKKLCINLPEFLQAHKSAKKTLGEYSTNSHALRNSMDFPEAISFKTQSKEKTSGTALPIEPRLADISDSMIQVVKDALQQSVGPIFNLIYEDVCSEIDQIKNRKDLAYLINLIVDEIDEDQYRNQFTHIINEQLIGIILIKE